MASSQPDGALSQSRAATSAWRMATVVLWFLIMAQESGVWCPASCRLGSAPLSNRRRTTSSRARPAASCSGVIPRSFRTFGSAPSASRRRRAAMLPVTVADQMSYLQLLCGSSPTSIPRCCLTICATTSPSTLFFANNKCASSETAVQFSVTRETASRSTHSMAASRSASPASRSVTACKSDEPPSGSAAPRARRSAASPAISAMASARTSLSSSVAVDASWANSRVCPAKRRSGMIATLCTGEPRSQYATA